MANLNSFIGQLNSALVGESSDILSRVLSLRKPVSASLIPEVMGGIEAKLGQRLESPYDELLAEALQSRVLFNRGDYVGACPHAALSVQAFLRAFALHEGSWSVPTLHSLAYDLRIIAEHGDEQLESRGESAACLADAAQHLMKGFGQCVSDRANIAVSKKWGALGLVNQLFRIYFKLNTLRLCKNLIRAVEGPGFPPLDQFPTAQTVTYRFFVGRLSIFEGDFGKAASDLMFAFDNCRAIDRRNKRHILLYLVPVRLLLGVMPQPHLLDKYDLPQYKLLSHSVKAGDLTTFEAEMRGNQEFFVHRGVLLLLERVRTLVLRNAFKMVHSAIGSPKILIGDFQAGLSALCGAVIDRDGIECILANLIHRGCMKGYISHQHATVVLAKDNAFPRWNGAFV